MKKLTLALAALLAISVIYSVQLWRALEGQRQRVAEITAKADTAPTEHPTAETRTAHVSGTRALALPDSCDLDVPQRDGPGEHFLAQVRALLTTIPPPMSGVPPEHELLMDPEYWVARKAQIRIVEAQMHPGLVEALGLSQSEAVRLFEEMAESQLSAIQDLSRHRDDSSPTAIVESLQRHSALQEESVRRLLGESKYSQMQDYRQHLQPALVQVALVRSELAGAGKPLTDHQYRGLAAAIQNEQYRLRDQGTTTQIVAEASAGQIAPEQVLDQIDRRKREIRRRIVAAAEQYLNADQLATLRKQLD